MSDSIPLTHIVFTGGGTAGHVTPNIALIKTLREQNCRINYIGSVQGVEKAMIEAENIPYFAIRCGKLRRYFSLKNFIDPFNLLIGIFQAYWLIRQLRPQVLFSKGGYVALPVVIGAQLNRIPVVAHESDMSPGLANRISFPFVNKICLTFAGAKHYFKHQTKVEVTGTPIRKELFQGDAVKGLKRCDFKIPKPCLMVIGGGQGSEFINHVIRDALPKLVNQFNIIHICGPNKLSSDLASHPQYRQFEYVNEGLADLYALSELVISRSGANTLSEILALTKPHVLIPLSKKSSRGDQIQNANYFQELNISVVVSEEELTCTSILQAIQNAWGNREEASAKMRELNIQSGTAKVIEVIHRATQIKGFNEVKLAPQSTPEK